MKCFLHCWNIFCHWHQKLLLRSVMVTNNTSAGLLINIIASYLLKLQWLAICEKISSFCLHFKLAINGKRLSCLKLRYHTFYFCRVMYISLNFSYNTHSYAIIICIYLQKVISWNKVLAFFQFSIMYLFMTFYLFILRFSIFHNSKSICNSDTQNA